MRKTVRRRYNKNGSITKSTTYSRKNMFGTRRITTYTQRSYPNNRGISTKIAINCIMIVTILIILGCYFLMVTHNIDYDIAVYFKITDIILLALLLLYDIPPLRTLCLFILKSLYKLICLFFRGIIKKITSEKDTTENKTELADVDFKDNNREQKIALAEKEPCQTNENQVAATTQRAKKILEHENNNVDIDDTINKARKEGEEIAKQIELDNEQRKIVDKSKIALNTENGIVQNPASIMISPYVVEPVDISVLLKEDDVRQAAVYAVEAGSVGVSVSYLQRKIKISYSRATRIMDMLEGIGIVGPFEGVKPRRVLVDKEWLDRQLENGAIENEGENNNIEIEKIINKALKGDTAKESTKNTATVVTTLKKFDDSTIEQLKKRYIAFDVETTGLNSYTERIIEVGAVVFENMIPLKEYGSLVNAQKTISAQTTAINHITNEMICNAPSEEQVYTELVNFLGDSLNAQTIICAHNADFDMGFLSKALRRLGFNAEINYVDTLSAAQRLAPESPDHKLSTLANHFRILVEQDHEAVSDAKVCGEILARLIALEQEEKEKRLIQEEEKRQQEELMQKMLIEYSDKRSQVSINPVHNRVPLDSIERLKKSDIEQGNGQEYWENGDILRKGGNIETAIEFFDKARYGGYCSPELYQSYAKAYRQLKDYDNEIDILDEAIYRFKNDRDVWEKFQTRRYKAVCLLIKKNEKTDKNTSEIDKTEKKKEPINV